MRINDLERWMKNREKEEAARKPFDERFYTDEPLLPAEILPPRTGIINCEEFLGIGPAHVLIAHVVHRLRSELNQRELRFKDNLPKGLIVTPFTRPKRFKPSVIAAHRVR